MRKVSFGFAVGLFLCVVFWVGQALWLSPRAPADAQAVEGTVCSPCSTHYTATVVRVVDGDTFDLEIALGLETFVRSRVRLIGIDAWETRGQDRARGMAAKRFAQDWLTASDSLEVRPLGNTPFQRCKYGRWLVRLCRPGSVCLNDSLVAEGHAEVLDAT